MRAMIDFETIDLDNCDQEPIHIPGNIQPHGVLLALDLQGHLTHASRNAAGVLPDLPALGDVWPAGAAGTAGPDHILFDAVAAALSDANTGQVTAPFNLEVVLCGEVFDVAIHTHDDRVLVELERRADSADDLSAFALLAHRSMGRLRHRKDIATLLDEAVGTIRHLTRFDRVMAYRFHQDDSGEIVTEDCLGELEPFLHRRFPASDIPVQARALYVRNPLRLIADVNDQQVPIDVQDPAARPLDLSHSVLRSVSPIHVEYLKNIQVGASMSLSIVVQGRLWALIACHHGTAHRVPYAVRMTCDVLSHVLSASGQSTVERLARERTDAAVAVRKQLTKQLLDTDDFALAFNGYGAALGQVISFDAALCVYGGVRGGSALSDDATSVLLRWLDAGESDLVAVHESASLPSAVRVALGPFCGLLGICIDRVNRGWIVLLRREQVETIVWSGIPAKLQRIGPLGMRLTPQGSLAEWRQTVEGTAVAWDPADLSIARDFMDALGRAGAANAARLEMARAQLLAILGHDLRDPLQTIGTMGRLLEQGSSIRHTAYGKRIASSIGRMQRLIGEVFEMSRLKAGLGLDLTIVNGDLAAFVQTPVEDARLAHPENSIVTDIAPTLATRFDPDRMAQVVINLLSNACNHGVIGDSIWVRLAADTAHVVLSVSNMAPPIPHDTVVNMFDPFKPRSVGNVRNPGGLGLGLYIASEVAKGHGGRLEYSHDGLRVTFTMTLPHQAASTASRS